MNHFHGGMAEDNLQTKLYDRDMYGKLFRYLKKYRWLVIASFIFLMIIVVFQLAMPIIQKIAVDEVIVSKKHLIKFDSEREMQTFLQKYPKLKAKIYDHKKNNYIIFSAAKTDFIAAEEWQNLNEKGKIKESIVIVENSPEIISLLHNTPFSVLSEKEIVVQRNKLTELKEKKIITPEELGKIRQRDSKKLSRITLFFLILVILQFFMMYLQIYTINYASQHAMYDLRRDLFLHLQKMPLSFFDKNPVGRLLTRVTNDIRTLDEMLSNGLIQLIQQFLVLAGIIIVMLLYNWKLALVTFAVLPIVVLLFIFFIRKTRIIYRDVRKRLAKINATLSENISGVKIIQLFNQFKRKHDEFYQINFAYYKKCMQQLRLFAVFRPLMNSMRRVSVALVLWYGGGQIIQDKISLGLFIAFLSYIDMFFEPINQLSEKFNILQAAMSGSERVFDLMEQKPEDYRNSLKENVKLEGEIEFKNVWLRYNENGDVLKNISFKIKPGEKIALVGHTGSGKTSIISLLSGFYPYQKGEILIDGNDLHDYSLEDLRSNIGIVQQDVFLFSGTIKDNIVLSDESISDPEMQQVARYVNVHDFIDAQPGKYLEPVMERGATFSVGQRQLIAFARVLAYDPAIFVLDEATSNIDTETEILIQDALQKLMENRTSIIIAHRLSTIQHVDRIIVLHKGEIVEEGNHQELLTKEGLYYDLYRLQYQ